jgi:hypothetical protein
VAESAPGNRSLWRLGPVRTLALEMSLNQSAERRLLDQRLRALETSWRKEEEIAAIVDDELTRIPPRLEE